MTSTVAGKAIDCCSRELTSTQGSRGWMWAGIDSHKSSVHLRMSVLENQIDKHRTVRRVVLSTR